MPSGAAPGKLQRPDRAPRKSLILNADIVLARHRGIDDSGPLSVYFTLHASVADLSDDLLPDAANSIEQALDATPESLRREWVDRRRISTEPG